MTLGNVKHNTRQIQKLIETHDKLYVELNDKELLNYVSIDIEVQIEAIITQRMEPYPSMRKWSADLYDRKQSLKMKPPYTMRKGDVRTRKGET